MELICADETGFRSVNDREAEALKYTFGVAVGNRLIKIIRVKIDPDLLRRGYLAVVENTVHGKFNQTEIKMRSDYSVENLWWLGVFIHEAVHIWQRNTGLHRGGTREKPRDYRYYHHQLPDLILKVEEHATAVQDWFYVNYGVKNGLVDGSYQITRLWLWRKILLAFGQDNPRVNLGLEELQQLVAMWAPVINEIRDPIHLE